MLSSPMPRDSKLYGPDRRERRKNRVREEIFVAGRALFSEEIVAALVAPSPQRLARPPGTSRPRARHRAQLAPARGPRGRAELAAILFGAVSGVVLVRLSADPTRTPGRTPPALTRPLVAMAAEFSARNGVG
jgi:hypothetical protein